MKYPRILFLSTLIGLSWLFSGCRKEVFLPDPSDTRLPRFTASGNQVGGALINNLAWKTNFWTSIDMGWNRSFYFSNYSSGDSATVTLDGKYTEGAQKDALVRFEVVLKHLTVKTLQDIRRLDGQTFVLDRKPHYARVIDFYGTFQPNVTIHSGGTGTITLSVVPANGITYKNANGTTYHPLIVAGKFEFSFPNIPAEVTQGRFDFLVDENWIDLW